MDAQTLKSIRLDLGYTQTRLATLLQLSARQIIRYETGESDIPGPVSVLLTVMVTRKIPA